MRVSLVVPVYNGAPFIQASLERLDEYLCDHFDSFEIIAVDDGSTDGTSAVLDTLSGLHVRVIRFPSNRGKFAAIKAGMLDSTGTCRIFTDADLPYDLEALPYMERLIWTMGYDLVVGDRVPPGSRYRESMSFLRLQASKIFSTTIRLLVTGELFDTRCDLKAFRGEIAELLFPLLRTNRFAGDVELLYIALKYNLALRRIPVSLRRSNLSSVRPFRDGLAMLGSISQLKRNWSKGRCSSQALFDMTKQHYCESAGTEHQGS